MQCYEITSPSGPDGWTRAERPSPTPGFKQVLVGVKAVSLNYRDLITAQNPKTPTGRIPLSDGAGVVLAVGDGVTQVNVGDRVAGCFFQNWAEGDVRAQIHDAALGGAIDGMLAEEVVLEEAGVVKIPDYLSFEEAASLPCAAVTVWNALFETGRLTAGQTVLLLGTGGVSIFGLQFAKAAGAKVIITSSSDEKLARAKDLGADELINYKTTPDWDKEVWTRTGKIGVDYVVEVGGGGTFEKSLKSTRSGGTVSAIGVLTGFGSKIDPFMIVGRSQHVNGIYVGSQKMFERMLTAMAQNRIKPVIDKVFPFEKAPDALRLMESGSHFGKIVVMVGQ